jgi:hypothetical protein
MTRLGGAGTIRGDGSTGMHSDDSITAAAQLALGFEGRMPDDKARAAFEGLPRAEVVRRALAALRNDIDDKEEPGDKEVEDGFVVTQDNNTEDNKTSGG